MKMMLGDYCLAFVRKADTARWEPEGFYAMRLGDHDYNRLPVATLDHAKESLLSGLPPSCCPFVTWTGKL